MINRRTEARGRSSGEDKRGEGRDRWINGKERGQGKGRNGRQVQGRLSVRAEGEWREMVDQQWKGAMGVNGQ